MDFPLALGKVGAHPREGTDITVAVVRAETNVDSCGVRDGH